MKRSKEKGLILLRFFILFLVIIVSLFAILYLLNVLPFLWVLNLILGIGILVHILVAVLFSARRKTFIRVPLAILGLFYLAAMIYINMI